MSLRAPFRASERWRITAKSAQNALPAWQWRRRIANSNNACMAHVIGENQKRHERA